MNAEAPMREQLLPCPFCGSQKVNLDDNDPGGDYTQGKGWSVHCLQCACCPHDGLFDTMEEAISCWNTRHQSTEQMKPLVDLAKECADMLDSHCDDCHAEDVIAERQVIRELRKAIAALPSITGWRCMKEAPSDGTNILALVQAFADNGADNSFIVSGYCEDDGRFIPHEGEGDYEPMGWMAFDAFAKLPHPVKEAA